MLTIVFWIIGCVSAIIPFLPGWTDEAGAPISRRELWNDGHGLEMVCLGIGLSILATLIFGGRPWVRHMLMAGLAAVGLSGFIQPDYEDVPVILLATIALATISFGVYYFYFRSTVIQHFARIQKEAEQVGDGDAEEAV